MVMLANSVRAGLSLVQSLEILAAECPSRSTPNSTRSLPNTTWASRWSERWSKPNSGCGARISPSFAAALLASHESGGRLNETVERIAQSVLELQRLDRKVMSETAQARKSAIYMAIAPAVILVAYYFIDPVNTTMLFTETIGHIVLATAVILNLLAYFWARLILRPENLTQFDASMTLMPLLADAAAMPQAMGLQFLASIAVGSSVCVARLVGDWVLQSEDIAPGRRWRYDVSRINELRRADPLYRLFQPVIGLLARMNRIVFRDNLAEIHREIRRPGCRDSRCRKNTLAGSNCSPCSRADLCLCALHRHGPRGHRRGRAGGSLTAWWLRRRLAARANARLR